MQERAKLEEYNAIMGELIVNTLILPTIGKDLIALVQALLGVSLDMVQHWCVFNKLNICLVFAYFSWLIVPVASRTHSYYLNAFYLCLLMRYFLMHETIRIDRRMCWVVSDLRRGNPIGVVLAETLNRLDVVHRKEANIFAGCSLFLQV